jgi:hypothetical protein
VTPGRIIQVRGASGSGKTTLVRNAMDALGGPWYRVIPKVDQPRRKPMYLLNPDLNLPKAVIGHYDVTCGGVDTIKHLGRPHELAYELAAQGVDVLMEGLWASVEVHKSAGQADTNQIVRHEVFVHEPVEVCRASVDDRRRGEGKPIREQKQMEGFHRRILQTEERIRSLGSPLINIHHCEGREQAAAVLHSLLLDKG